MDRLTHIASDGSAQMVDVSAKPLSNRVAVASARIRLRPETLELISQDRIAKGNVFAVARIAGIQAAKQTSQLIPLCHNLDLSHVEITFEPVADGVEAKVHRSHDGANRRGDGSLDRRNGSVAHHLRHVQSRGQRDANFRCGAYRKN